MRVEGGKKDEREKRVVDWGLVEVVVVEGSSSSSRHATGRR